MYKYALAVLLGASSLAFADGYCIVNSLDTGNSVYVTIYGPGGTTTNLMCGAVPNFPYCNSPNSSSSSSGSQASSSSSTEPFPPEDCTVQGPSSSSASTTSSSQSSTQSSASSP